MLMARYRHQNGTAMLIQVYMYMYIELGKTR